MYIVHEEKKLSFLGCIPFKKAYLKFAPANYWPEHRKKIKKYRKYSGHTPATGRSIGNLLEPQAQYIRTIEKQVLKAYNSQTKSNRHMVSI